MDFWRQTKHKLMKISIFFTVLTCRRKLFRPLKIIRYFQWFLLVVKNLLLFLMTNLQLLKVM
jgi:hypothetical protein